MLFSRVEVGKKDCGKHLVRKENFHCALTDLKLMQNFAFTGMTDLLHGSLKKNTAMKLFFFIKSTSRAGVVRTTVGLVQNVALALLAQTMDLNVMMVMSKKHLLKIYFCQQMSHWAHS